MNNRNAVTLSRSLLTSLFLTGQVFPEGTWAIITAEGSQVSPLDLLTLKSIPASECMGLCQAACPPQLGSPLCHAQYGCLSLKPGQDAGLGALEKTQRLQKSLNKKLAKHWKRGRKEEGEKPGYRCAAAGRLKLQVEKVTGNVSLSFSTVKNIEHWKLNVKKKKTWYVKLYNAVS